MSDLLAAVATHTTAADRYNAARDTAKAEREALADAFDALVVAASSSDVSELAETAKAVSYCDDEIAATVADPDTGTKALTAKVREAAGALREAAKAGDAKAALVNLTSAEDELAEAKLTLRDLRRARKEAAAKLLKLAAGTV